MASDSARAIIDDVLNPNINNLAELQQPGSCHGNEATAATTKDGTSGPNETLPREKNNDAAVKEDMSTSSYALTSDLSCMSGDVDRWIHGSTTTRTENAGVQGSRVAVSQRSTTTSSCLASNTMWYLAPMVLPLYSFHNCVMTLRCTPSNVLNSAEILAHKILRIFANARDQIRRLIHEQITTDLFAAAMDVVLLIYTLGFLVLSMYQASIIG